MTESVIITSAVVSTALAGYFYVRLCQEVNRMQVEPNKGVDNIGEAGKIAEAAPKGDGRKQRGVHVKPPSRPAVGLPYYLIELADPAIRTPLYVGYHFRWESDQARAIHFEFQSTAEAWGLFQLGLDPREYRIVRIHRILLDV